MTKRRSSSEGSISQLPSGHWRGRVYLQGRRITATRRTKVEIIAWIREIKDQAEAGLSYQATRMLLGEFMVRWMEMKRSQVRAKTLQSYSDIIRIYIHPRLGKVKLIELTPGIVQGFLDRLVAEKVGARTVQLCHAILRGSLKHAQHLGLVIRNPAEVCVPPKPVRAEMAIWSESQVNAFLAGVQGERNEYLYHMALSTGMRQGELLGLRWEDIDFLSGKVQVVRQAQYLRGKGMTFQEPKSKRGIRSVELGPGMIDRMRDQLKRVGLAREFAGERWVENDLVFPSTVGTVQSNRNLSRDFEGLVNRSGLPAIRFHDLRHTAATILLSHGIPPVIVAGRLGHTLAILMDRYAHFIPSMQGEAARLMDEVTAIELMGHV